MTLQAVVFKMGEPIELTDDNYDLFCFALRRGYKFDLRAKKPRRDDVTKGNTYAVVSHTNSVYHMAIIDDTNEESCLTVDHLNSEEWEVMVREGFPSVTELNKMFEDASAANIKTLWDKLCDTHQFKPGQLVIQKPGLEIFVKQKMNPVMVFVEAIDTPIDPPKGMMDTQFNGVRYDCRVLIQPVDETKAAGTALAVMARLMPYKG